MTVTKTMNRMDLMVCAAALGWRIHEPLTGGRRGPSTDRYEITWTWDQGRTRLVHAALWEKVTIPGRRQRLRLVDVIYRGGRVRPAQILYWLRTYGTGQ